ncbi:MAG: acyltransferase [Hymenobacter sp.]|nr:MAG: acyltransferase [Hymenobacter sp.]
MIATFTPRISNLPASAASLPAQSFSLRRINWPALALARFFLAFIVVATHALEYTSAPGPLLWISRLDAFNAIVGFLLISGLSIGKSILKDKEGYYKRRAQRIYPVYLASIALQYFLTLEHISVKFLLLLVANVFFLNQIITSTSYIGPAWTLALEVWLYALAPLLLRVSYKKLVYITCFSFACYAAYTCGRTLFHWNYYSGVPYGLNLLFLSFIWISGFLLATFEDKLKTTSHLILTLLAGHFLLTTLIQVGFRVKHHQLAELVNVDALNFIVGGICLALVYYVVIDNRKLPVFSATQKNIANLLGNISYPLYVSHYAILVFCHSKHITNWEALAGCCLVVAWLIYWLFDYYSRKRAA